MANAKFAEMDLFSVVEDARVITVEKGVYKQVPLYTRNGGLYAEHRTGFARLIVDGATSVPNLKWDAVEGVNLGNQRDRMPERHKAMGLTLPTRAQLRAIAAPAAE